MEGALASDAPRFAASMMPGPPPVAMTLSRMPPRDMSAPPRSDAISTEAPRFLIPPRRLIARTRHGTGRQCCGVLSSILAAARQHTCAAENDDSRADDPSAKPLFRLRVFPVAGVRRAWNRPEENRDRARGGGMHRNLFARYYRLWTFGSSCDNTQPACRLVDECRLIEDGALS